MIAPVRAGLEDELRDDLNRWGNDIRGARVETMDNGPRIDFPQSHTIHFARLTLLDDPDRPPSGRRLLLVTDFDGTFADHAAELWRLSKNPEALWGRCEGYSGPDDFEAFIRRHRVSPQAYYMAFRGEKLERLRRAIGFREWYHAWLADPRAHEVLAAWPDARTLIGGFSAIASTCLLPVRTASRWAASFGEVIGLIGSSGIAPVLRAAKGINATLSRVGWIRVFNWLFRNSHPAPPHRYSQAEWDSPANPTPPGYPPEDAVFQNQLTLVTDIRPGAEAQLRLVLALVDLFGRRLSNPGELVGISTIHTVRWAVIDGGRRLLMASNYDGTWEHYIDEFAEMILSGLDALWSSAPDYPRAGAQDVAALKQFLRSHQAPANVFYSAYPSSSVLNLKHDLEFMRRFGGVLRTIGGQGSGVRGQGAGGRDRKSVGSIARGHQMPNHQLQLPISVPSEFK